MNYESILKRLEEEKKEKGLSEKLYRYTGLVKAIDFFSQKLVFEQIIEAAFDFVNELLLVDKSVIYVIDNGIYKAKKIKGCSDLLNDIEVTSDLKNVAKFYGNIIYGKEKIASLFNTELIDLLDINSVVPLIIEDSLYGFILLHKSDISDDDYIISEALMRLINNALENFNKYERLLKANSELDEKIFNLFAINQSSKILLSELRLEELFNIAVEVFSELTRSKVTGFVLFDDQCGSYILKSFKDVFYSIKGVNIRLRLNPGVNIDSNKVIIDLRDDKDCSYFTSLFYGEFNPSDIQLEQLEAMYIVLILKNSRILGFVTLSETVTGSPYSEGIFELIESLASSTYTALTNAKLFEEIKGQKIKTDKRLEKMSSLRTLIKNISSSNKVDTLLDMAIKTLQISFNVDKGAFCLYERNTRKLEFAKTVNMDKYKNKSIVPNQHWKRVFEGDTIYALGQASISRYIGEDFPDLIENAQGILIIPVYIDIMEVELLGAIVVFKYNDLQLDDEESMLILESIAGNIAPALNNLLIIQMQKRFMLPNFIELFKNDLKKEISAALLYNLNLSVIQVEDERDFLFKGNSVIDRLKDSFKKVYPFSYNDIFIISNEDADELEAEIIDCTGVEDLGIKKMALRKDFNDFADFFTLYR